MERQEIDPAKKKEVQKLTSRVVIGMIAVLAIYIVYALAAKKMNIVLFQVMLAAFIVVYTVMLDVVEPYRLGKLKNMTIGQRDAYTKMMIIDVVAVGCILYWIMGMSDPEGDASILPVVLYFFFMQMKRKFQPEFEGTAEKEEETEGEASEVELVEEEAEAIEEETETSDDEEE